MNVLTLGICAATVLRQMTQMVATRSGGEATVITVHIAGRFANEPVKRNPTNESISRTGNLTIQASQTSNATRSASLQNEKEVALISLDDALKHLSHIRLEHGNRTMRILMMEWAKSLGGEFPVRARYSNTMSIPIRLPHCAGCPDMWLHFDSQFTDFIITGSKDSCDLETTIAHFSLLGFMESNGLELGSWNTDKGTNPLKPELKKIPMKTVVEWHLDFLKALRIPQLTVIDTSYFLCESFPTMPLKVLTKGSTLYESYYEGLGLGAPYFDNHDGCDGAKCKIAASPNIDKARRLANEILQTTDAARKIIEKQAAQGMTISKERLQRDGGIIAAKRKMQTLTEEVMPELHDLIACRVLTVNVPLEAEPLDTPGATDTRSVNGERPELSEPEEPSFSSPLPSGALGVPAQGDAVQ